MAKQANLTLDELFDIYIKKCTIKNLSEKTIESYKITYSIFVKFIGVDLCQ